ncbi:SigE family RNA polymerase sigma factor [Frankia sp. AgB1.9]|nr:SigE family RNA polymerase sigma factor [Frankia sp. AgW1.1]MBL7552387.1 SigE family RNA polymerase sigma factor [Frankia sp. AgB1.9]MBL7619640.1 SigE family RNA polymerase sigma factor [Frankia sp. AgB1.8]
MTAPPRPASRAFPPSDAVARRTGTATARAVASPTQAEEFPEPPTADQRPAGAVGRPAQAEFEKFFEAHHRELARFAFLLSGDRDAAEDITAEALTSAWVHWDRVQAADNPLAYVRRSVANLAAGRIRRTVRERNVLAKLGRQLPIQATNGPDVPAVLDLESALLRLPLRKRQCVILRHGLDLSEAETADTLGISIGTVKSQTSKAVSELERLLAAGGSGVGATSSSGASATARKRPRLRRVALRGGEA